MTNHSNLVKFPLEDLIGEGMIRETDFRHRLDEVDWEQYRDRMVMLPWIHGQEMPTWVYLMTTARLSRVVSVLSFGEMCSPTILYRRRHLRESAETG